MADLEALLIDVLRTDNALLKKEIRRLEGKIVEIRSDFIISENNYATRKNNYATRSRKKTTELNARADRLADRNREIEMSVYSILRAISEGNQNDILWDDLLTKLMVSNIDEIRAFAMKCLIGRGVA